MCILIGIVGVFLALSVAAAVPGNDAPVDQRPRGRRVPGDSGSARRCAARDGFCMPIPR